MTPRDFASDWSGERWLAEVLDALPVAVWSVRRDGSIAFARGAVISTLGLDPQALVGRDFFALFAVQPELISQVRRTLAGEGSFTRAQFGGRVFETRLTPLGDGQGEVVAAMAVSVDVTDRARDEAELERRSRLLHAVSTVAQRFLSTEDLEASTRRILDVIGRTLDVGRVYVFENRFEASGRIVSDLRWEWVADGVPRQLDNPKLQQLGLLDERFQEITVPLSWGETVAKSTAECSPELAEFLRGFGIETQLVAPIFVADRFWGLIGCHETRGAREWTAEETGALRAVAALFGAARERQRVVGELRENEEKYRELVENATDLVWSISLEGRFLSANRAMATLLGYELDEIVGEPWEKLIPEPEQQEIVRRAIREKVSGDRARTTYEVRLRAKDGRFVQVEVSSRLVERDGRAAAIHGTGRDVSERRRLEEQLRQAVKMEAVGRLAGGVAHDFNNLLTAISGYGERILARLRATDPMRGEVMEILKAGERAADLTRELMAFGRRQPAMPKEIDLNRMIEQRLGMLRRIVGDEVVVVNLAEARIGRILADPTLVEQVLVNLMVNARDAMPRGGRIELATAPADPLEIRRRGLEFVPHPGYARLSVRDTGEGMDAATMARIFEPFFTTKELGKGSGLGLSTVYGIVKQCEGYIFADSHPGQGTVFHVYFPEASPAVRPAARPSGEHRVAVPQRESILLVEDEDLIRNLAEQILLDHGYRVFPAANAAEAIELSGRTSEEFDLLLTDIVMPGVSGSDLAQRLLRHYPKMRVLYMSGYSDSLIFRYGVLQERAAFLQKPFSADVLERKVRELLDG